MKKMLCSLAGATLAFLLVIALGTGVQAQTGQAGGQQTMPQPGASGPVSDADLERVAMAYSEIYEIRMDLQESLAGVTEPDMAQQMQEQAGAAMVQAVQSNGLDVNTYNHIMQEVQTNMELREKLETKLEGIQ